MGCSFCLRGFPVRVMPVGVRRGEEQVGGFEDQAGCACPGIADARAVGRTSRSKIGKPTRRCRMRAVRRLAPMRMRDESSQPRPPCPRVARVADDHVGRRKVRSP